MRAVVLGSGFGRRYLEACREDPAVEVIALVGRGSERSKEVAASFGVPLLGSLDELPREVELAFVAVGRKSAEVPILELLRRGIHVISEHPVSVGLVDRAARKAESSGVCFHVGFHVGDYAIAGEFIESARAAIAREPPLFVSAFTSPRCLWSLVDVLGRVFGGLRPWIAFREAGAGGSTSAVALRAGVGAIAGVPASIQLTSFVAAADDRSDAFLNHQITIGFRSGNLILADTFGPVIRCAQGLSEVVASGPALQSSGDPKERERAREATIGAAIHGAIRTSIHRLIAHRDSGERPPEQAPQYLRDVFELSMQLELAFALGTRG